MKNFKNKNVRFKVKCLLFALVMVSLCATTAFAVPPAVPYQSDEQGRLIPSVGRILYSSDKIGEIALHFHDDSCGHPNPNHIDINDLPNIDEYIEEWNSTTLGTPNPNYPYCCSPYHSTCKPYQYFTNTYQTKDYHGYWGFPCYRDFYAVYKCSHCGRTESYYSFSLEILCPIKAAK
jgi:hypothetical protein